MSTLSTEEARLVGVYRAIGRFKEEDIVRAQDASLLLSYFQFLADVPELEKSDTNLELFLDGFVAGFAAGRLSGAGIDPETFESTPPNGQQTGVDPLTGLVRT